MSNLLRFSGKDIQGIDLEEWLREKPEALRPIACRWLEVIRNCGRDVEQIFHDNYPIGCVGEAAFAYVNAYTSHVNVGFFYGMDLPDEKGLLQGTGKRMRHIKIRPEQHCDENAVRALIKYAYMDIQDRLRIETSKF